MRSLIGVVLVAACGRIEFDRPPTTDAAPADDGAADQPRCNETPTCPPFALLCDSFEGAAIDTIWTDGVSSGTVAVDAQRACRGGQSLHAHTNPVASGAVKAEVYNTTLAFARTTLFFRFYIFLSSTTGPATASQSWMFVKAGQNSGNYYGVELEDFQSRVRFINYKAVDDAIEAQLAYPLDRWTCVEWEIDFPSADGAADGATRVGIDGEPLPELDPFGGLQMPPSTQPIATVEIGLFASTVTSLPGADAWIDDLVIANQPVHCGD